MLKFQQDRTQNSHKGLNVSYFIHRNQGFLENIPNELEGPSKHSKTV